MKANVVTGQVSEPHAAEMNLFPGLAGLQEFWRALLPATLQNALRTEFYRNHWSSSSIPDDVNSLHSLPVVKKQHLRAAGVRAQVRKGLICDEVFTSGTTGIPLVTVRGNREQEFIRDFFRQIHRESQPPFLRGLQINNPYHGYHISIPSPIHFHRIGIYDSGCFEHGRQILLESHYDENIESECSVLVGLERCLRAFTLDTRTRYPAGIASRLSVVISYSQYLTKHWRELFRTTWQCPVVDRFSLSEVFGGASECLECQWWHFDPFLIPEVVSHRQLLPVREGNGILVLTALYPFQEAQPMVRYYTGDLVEATYSRSCRPGTLSIRPLGRSAFGVPFPETDEWLITPAAILEAIDAQPEVARLPRFLDSKEVMDPFLIGHPKYHTSYYNDSEGVHVTISIEPKADADVAMLTNNIKGALLAESQDLERAIQTGRASLDIVLLQNPEPDLLSHSM